MTRVKICGITHPEDAELCAAAGADALGFVVEYPKPTPWHLTREEAARLMRPVAPFVTRVAVVGGDAAGILAIYEHCRPDALQLHGDESEAVVAELARALAGTGVRLVKALRVDPARAEPPGHWVDEARRFVAAGAHALLVDSVTAARPAGTGQAVDRSLARAVVAAAGVPCVLAGGLNAGNVAAAVTEVGPYAVDVISSVEDAAHRKDPDRVAAFVAAARGAVA